MTWALKTCTASAAAFLLATAAPATIIIHVDDPGALQPGENVLFDNGSSSTFNATSGFNEIVATTNMGTDVLFQGNEALTGQASGQAYLTGSDSNLTFIQIAPVSPSSGYQAIEFLLAPVTGGGPQDPFSGTVTFTDQNDIQFSNNFSSTSGPIWLSAVGVDGQYITSMSVNLNSGQFADIRQVRINGVGVVPEPAAWAMMITGFGLVGGAMRYRRKMPSLA